jgi:hypothetical protein
MKRRRKFGLLSVAILAVLFLAGGRKRRAKLSAMIAPLARRVAHPRKQARTRSTTGGPDGRTSDSGTSTDRKPTLLHSILRVAAGIQGRIGDMISEAGPDLSPTPPEHAAGAVEPGADAPDRPEDVEPAAIPDMK